MECRSSPVGHGLPTTVSLAETIGGLVINAIGIAALVSILSDDLVVPIEFGVLQVAAPVLVGLLVASAVFNVVKFRVGRWTRDLAITNALLNLAYGVWWSWAGYGLGRISQEHFVASDGIDWATRTAMITVAVVVAILVRDGVEGFKGAGRSTTA
jgi:hypothetical protein